MHGALGLQSALPHPIELNPIFTTYTDRSVFNSAILCCCVECKPKPTVLHRPVRKGIGMTVMAKVSTSVICENAKMARDLALTGNYDAAGIYYEGVLQSLQKHICGIMDPLRKQRWTIVQQQVSKEYQQMKAIQKELCEMTMDLQIAPIQALRRTVQTEQTNAKNPAAWFQPDPDVWPPPQTNRDPDIWGPAPPLTDMR